MSNEIKVTVSPQANQMLRELVAIGLFGRSVSEVSRRLIDKGLIELAEQRWVEITKHKHSKARGRK